MTKELQERLEELACYRDDLEHEDFWILARMIADDFTEELIAGSMGNVPTG